MNVAQEEEHEEERELMYVASFEKDGAACVDSLMIGH